MIRTLYYSPTGELKTDIPETKFQELLQEKEGLLWVDFESNPPEQDEPILRDIFHFHPLAIDDALQESHVPKLDDWGEYLYIVLHSARFETDGGGHLETDELDVFLGDNYIVTHHDQELVAIQRVWDLSHRDDRHLRNGPDHLLYRLVDEVVASYMPVVEKLDAAIDVAEDQVFSQPSPNTLEQIFQLKRTALHLRRIIGPQREVLNKLARDDYKVIDVKARIYYRDVYDHLVRLHDLTESIRDLVSGALDTYLSVINNRMNEIMKTLTIITVIFSPLTFITGFFGMNFFSPSVPLDIWTGWPAFIATLIIIAVTPIFMYMWIRRRGWM